MHGASTYSFRSNEDLSPTDRATVKWPEEGKGEFKLFATIHIPAGAGHRCTRQTTTL